MKIYKYKIEELETRTEYLLKITNKLVDKMYDEFVDHKYIYADRNGYRYITKDMIRECLVNSDKSESAESRCMTDIFASLTELFSIPFNPDPRKPMNVGATPVYKVNSDYDEYAEEPDSDDYDDEREYEHDYEEYKVSSSEIAYERCQRYEDDYEGEYRIFHTTLSRIVEDYIHDHESECEFEMTNQTKRVLNTKNY